MSKRRSLAIMAHRRFSYGPRLVLLACPWRRCCRNAVGTWQIYARIIEGHEASQYGIGIVSPHCRNSAPRRAQRDPDRQLPTRIWRHAVLAERCWSRRRDNDFASRPVCRGEKWVPPRFSRLLKIG